MSNLQTVKRYLQNGQAAQLAVWAKQNAIKDIDQLMAQATQELKSKIVNNKG